MNDRFRLIVEKQRAFFGSGATRDIDFRKRMLADLEAAIRLRETEILDALCTGQGKPLQEAYSAEIGFLLVELKYVRGRLSRWARAERVWTMPLHWPARSEIRREPYGVVCIISPWNYPVQLALSPLIGAIAAGNCAVVKQSEFTPVSTILTRLLSETFAEEYIASVETDAKGAESLLDNRFDYIFFTGGTETGRSIMLRAARHLTPCTMELGGKNPCLVDHDADLRKAADRIAWGKFFNAGQTCAAPDYLLVDRRIKDKLQAELKVSLRKFYGDNALDSPDLARIIDERHFDRLAALLKDGDIIWGGGSDKRSLKIEPTLIENVRDDSALKRDEIFGPILPIIAYQDFSEALGFLKLQPKPLSLYIFSRDNAGIRLALEQLPAGGYCINGTLSQLMSLHLPFGGVGESGTGNYHGFHSFNTFSRQVGVMHRSFLLDNRLVYPPYRTKMSFLKKALRGLMWS